MLPEFSSDTYLGLRQKMVQTQLAARGIKDARLLEVMAQVYRHEFVPNEYRNEAYADSPLPIGHDQTISQPYIVALTLAALELSASSRVLEIGTGSGYQTAILSKLAGHVYSIERHKQLADTARNILEQLGYNNVTVLLGDGSLGLPDHAPYDAIAVSAAAPQIPKALMDQLNNGGRMVIPVGPAGLQQLKVVRKINDRVNIQTLENCRFVPLISG